MKLLCSSAVPLFCCLFFVPYVLLSETIISMLKTFFVFAINWKNAHWASFSQIPFSNSYQGIICTFLGSKGPTSQSMEVLWFSHLAQESKGPGFKNRWRMNYIVLIATPKLFPKYCQVAWQSYKIWLTVIGRGLRSQIPYPRNQIFPDLVFMNFPSGTE